MRSGQQQPHESGGVAALFVDDDDLEPGIGLSAFVACSRLVYTQVQPPNFKHDQRAVLWTCGHNGTHPWLGALASQHAAIQLFNVDPTLTDCCTPLVTPWALNAFNQHPHSVRFFSSLVLCQPLCNHKLNAKCIVH